MHNLIALIWALYMPPVGLYAPEAFFINRTPFAMSPASTPETEFTHTHCTLLISNIQHRSGKIFIAVYDSRASFLKPDKAVFIKVVSPGRSATLEIPVPLSLPGTYAFSCYHDLNDDGQLNTNLLGIPTEPYGFSNGARPKFRAPRWSEVGIFCLAGNPRVEVVLNTW
jgi:uncharacterized protein (DUF2141 family)